MTRALHCVCLCVCVDVGGQRNERAKWRKQLDDVAALLFVTALNHYNEVLFEDENVNGMHEAVRVFSDIINDEAFVESQIILFFNKVDLFDKQIMEFPLGVCFGKDVSAWKGPYWEGPDIAKPEGAGDDWEPLTDAEATAARDAALEFIQEIFLEKDEVPNRRIYKHVTCATNADNVKDVFWDVQNIVIKANLIKSGLMTQG